MNTKNLQTLILFIILVIVLCCVYNIERFTNKKISFQHIYSRAYGSHMGMDQILNQYRKIEDYYKYPFNLKQYYYTI
jgi:hypothetical protein